MNSNSWNGNSPTKSPLNGSNSNSGSSSSSSSASSLASLSAKYVEQLKSLEASLKSSKATERRATVDKLRSMTIQLRSESNLSLISRPLWSKCLIDSLIPSLEEEVLAQMKLKIKNVRKYITEPLGVIVKCLVECTDCEEKNGDVIVVSATKDHHNQASSSTGQDLLTKNAIHALFEHIFKQFDDVNKRLHFTADYCDIVRFVTYNRSCLLKFTPTEMCQWLKRLMSLVTDSKHQIVLTESKQFSQTVQFILVRYPHDTTSVFEPVLQMFTRYFEKCEQNDGGLEATNLHLITALNSLLIRNAQDFIPLVRQFCERFASYLTQVWTTTKSEPLRAEICLLLRIVMEARLSKSVVGVLSSETISAIYGLVIHGLSEPRLFSQAARNISHKQMKVRRHHLKLFFDLSADIFYLTLNHKDESSELGADDSPHEPQSKRRRLTSRLDRIIEKIRSKSTHDTANSNWQTLLLHLIDRYMNSLPAGFISSAIDSLASLLSNQTVCEKTFEVLELLAINFDHARDHEMKQQWIGTILPTVTKFITTESAMTLPALRVIQSILIYISPTIVASDEIANIFTSKFFQQAQYCDDVSIAFATTVVTLQKHHNCVNSRITEQLVEWIINYLRQPRDSRSDFVSPDSISLFIDSIVDRLEISHMKRHVSEIDDSKHGKYLNRFSLLYDPFQVKKNTCKTAVDNKVSTLVDTDVLLAVLNQLSTVINGMAGHELSTMSQKVDTCLYLMTVLSKTRMYRYKDSMDTVSKMFVTLIRCVARNIQRTSSWSITLKLLLDVVQFTNENMFHQTKDEWTLIVKALSAFLSSCLREKMGALTSSNDDSIGDDDLSDITTSTVTFKLGCAPKNQRLIEETLKVLSSIGQRYRALADTVYNEIRPIIDDVRMSVLFKMEIILKCCEMGDPTVCVKVFPKMPSSVKDPKSFAMILNIVGVCIQSCDTGSPLGDEIVSLLDACEKILKNFKILLNRGELAFEARESLVLCVRRLIGTSRFESFEEGITDTMNDPNYFIRLETSRLFSQLSIPPSRIDTFFARIVNSTVLPLLREGQDVKQRTAIVALSFFSLRNQSVMHQIIVQLASIYSRYESLSGFIDQNLHYISTICEYGSISELLEQNVKSLMFYWSREHPIEKFPYALFGQSSIGQMLHDYGATIIPFVIEKEESLEQIVSLYNAQKRPRDLVVAHFSSIFAYYYSVHVKSNALGGKMDSFVRQALGSDFAKMVSSEMDNILVDVLLSATCDDNGQEPPFFSVSTILAVLDKMASMFKLSTVEFLLASKGRVQQLLYALHEQMMTTPRVPAKLDAIKGLEILVDVLGSNGLCVLSTLRYLIHILLSAARSPGLEDVSYSLLLKLLQLIDPNMNRKMIDVMATKLQTIVNSLVTRLTSLPDSARQPNPAYKVLEHLMLGNRWIQGCLSHLDPTSFDVFGALWPIRRSFLQQRRVSFSEEVALFNERSGADGVIQFVHVLKQRENKLADELATSADSMVLVIAKLLKICRGHYSTSDKFAAGECLAILGLSTSLSQDQSATLEYEFDTVSMEAWTTDAIRKTAHKRVVDLLNSYIVDDSVHVVRVASEALRKILVTKPGSSTFKLLSEGTQESLDPFQQTSNATRRPLSTAYVKFMNRMQYGESYDVFSDGLFKTEDRTYEQWIVNVAHSLIKSCVKDEVLRFCADVALCKPDFAEKVFPYLLFDISVSENAARVCEQLSPLIKTHVLSNPTIDVRAIRVLLSSLHILYRHTVDLLRIGKYDMKKKVKYWLNLSALSVAEAALRADATHTAVFYIELYNEENQVLTTLPPALTFEDSAPKDQALLLQAYQRINEPDGIDGVPRTYGFKTFILKAERERDYLQALGSYEAIANNETLDRTKIGMVDCLKNMGLNRTSTLVLRGIGSEGNSHVQELLYEQAWRNATWDDAPATATTAIHAQFNQSIFQCLSSIRTSDEKSFRAAYLRSRELVIREIASSIDISPALVKLHMVSDVNGAWIRKITANNLGIPISKWFGLSGTRMTDKSFNDIEPLLALRSTIVQLFEPNDPTHLLLVADMARQEHQFSYASSIINRLSSSESYKESMSLWLAEHSRLLWTRGEQDSAINVANLLLSHLEEKRVRGHKLASVHGTIGRWLMKSQSDSADTILPLLLKGLETDDKCKAYRALSKFYDSTYTSLSQSQQSEEVRTRVEIIATNKERVQRTFEANRVTPSNDPVSYHRQVQALSGVDPLLRDLVKSITRDESYIQSLNSRCKDALHETMSNLIHAASHGDKYDTSIIFRLCSLWFSNMDDPRVNELMDTARQKLPMYKFLPLMYQIASRISSLNSAFHKQVYKLMYQLCSHYPHHSLLQVFALANGDIVTVNDKNAQLHSADTERIVTAKNLLKQLTTQNQTLLMQYQAMVDAYIELAYEPVHKERLPKRINPKNKIMNLGQLNCVMVPTAEIPIHKHQQQQQAPQSGQSIGPTIVKFDEAISFAGGVNQPKIIQCLGSDGKLYKQLVKGRDDLRQDAVMQQLFALVNNLLCSDKNTNKRNLRIRTYKVIPLSPTTGVLAWVRDTVPMLAYLIGPDQKSGAHARYRPKDYTHMQCRQLIHSSVQFDVKKKMETYRKICQNFKPVLHHFFIENFATPTEWFGKRLNYTRSVATNSIVGYIMGLGDRHLANMLLDTKSAEVVHIDFGVAFDQGQLLPIPEGVPFRLTRDIVDGFGVTGVEGVFRNCAEHTMTVLRDHAELISLIVGVLIHDPLYNWSLTKEQLMKHQDHNISVSNINIAEKKSVSVEAKRALLRLNEKLKGLEEGQNLSVKGHVNKLIKTATSEQQLACLFSGWGAHL